MSLFLLLLLLLFLFLFLDAPSHDQVVKAMIVLDLSAD